MFGLFNVSKPFDVTSREVVDHVQRLVRPDKAGHAGTLDPLATGVLVICVGQATRLIDFVQAQSKHYVATFQLGCSSETEDTEGAVLPLPDPPVPSPFEIGAALAHFRGRIMQRPPVYSALKVKGRRAYALARRGRPVALAPREVVIHRLELVSYAYPELVLDVHCGSGTYVRSLGRDIAESLGTAAVMSALERRAIGPFRIEEACRPDQLTAESIADWMLPAEMAVDHLPRFHMTLEQARDISHGRPIAGVIAGEGTLAVALDAAHAFVGLLTTAGPGLLKPYRNFSAEVDRP